MIDLRDAFCENAHMSETCQLLLLPGVGADARLLDPQRAAFPDLVVPDWLEPRRKEPLADYAVRMAELVADERPLVLGGVSFGGMVAYEMARTLKPEAVVLIASMRARRGLRFAYRMARPLATTLPLSIAMAKFIARPTLFLATHLPKPERHILTTMFREMDSRFMSWALTALTDWPADPLEGVPVHQIHGRRDCVLPAWRSGADEFVPKAGHLVNVSHADTVNAFLRRVIAGCVSSETMAQ